MYYGVVNEATRKKEDKRMRVDRVKFVTELVKKDYSIKNLSGMHNMKSDKIAAVFLILILIFGGVVLCLQYM